MELVMLATHLAMSQSRREAYDYCSRLDVFAEIIPSTMTINLLGANVLHTIYLFGAVRLEELYEQVMLFRCPHAQS